MNLDLEEIIKWAIAAATCVAIAWAPVACSMHENNKIEAAVDKGVNPILARCAYSHGSTSAPACIVATAKEPK